jgi:hypothetical protein
MKIKIYVHLNDLPGAFELMSEQLTLVSEVGLLDAAAEVVLCTNGNPNSFDAAKQILNKEEYPNVTFVHTSDRTNLWEYPTLDLMKQECDVVREEEFYICYFHLKGLSRLGDQRVKDWREYMQYWCIERWEDNVKKLDEGIDTVGTNFIETPWPHYSGNFWWARASYIRKLDPLVHPDNLPWGQPSKYINAKLDDGNFRYEHEAWIGSKNPVWAELHSTPGKLVPGWHFENTYSRELYATETSETTN